MSKVNIQTRVKKLHTKAGKAIVHRVVLMSIELILLCVSLSACNSQSKQANLPDFCQKVTSIPKNECSALLALSDVLDNWYLVNKKWFHSTQYNPCDWLGLSCEDEHIIDIKIWLKKSITKVPTEFEQFTQLESLNLWGMQVQDITPLAGLTNLRTLILSGTQVRDIAPLASLVDLSYLDLASTQVQDITPLVNLTSLNALTLSGTQVRDIAPLASLVDLHYLDLASTQVRDIAPLASLTNLRELDLNTTAVYEIAPVANLHNLNQLILYKTPVQDITPLTTLTQLRTLYLNETQVKDISPLANLIDLKELWISGTQVTPYQVKWLQERLLECRIVRYY